MKLTCPACGNALPVEALLADGEAREVMALSLSLSGDLGKRVLRYLALFRHERRGLAWDRAHRLLAELVAPIEAASLERNGRLWPAPREVWIAAIDQVLEARDAGRLVLPLKSHGYLYEIVVGTAGKAEGRAEIRREDAARAGRPEGREPRTKHARADMPVQVREQLAALGALKRAMKGGD